jgi:hypothetical protein
MRKEGSKRVRKRFDMEEPESDKGVFIIDSGKCSIINRSLPDCFFTEIYRSAVFGESTHLEVAGLDYFGDIVAGPKDIKKEDNNVVCLYLSEANFQRVPYHELKTAFEAQMIELDMICNFAAKRFKQSKKELAKY